MVRVFAGLVAATVLNTALLAPIYAQSSSGGATADAPAASPAQAPVDGNAPSLGAGGGAAPLVASPADASTPGAPATVVQTASTQTAARRIIDACMLPPIKLSAQDIEAFLANPSDLLASYGAQSLTLSNRVRSLAGSDGRTLAPILALVQTATDDQKAGIGSGLGRTSFMCQSVNPDYAQEIQSQIADLDAPALLTAFLTASNDMQVAAIGGGGVGGGAAGAPGLAGGGVAGPGSAGALGDSTVANLSTAYLGRSGGFVATGSSDDGDVTINLFGGTSVSPSTLN